MNELMGKHGDRIEQHGLEFDDLKHLLGEKMPKLEFHALGRVRLTQALRGRFGEGYRNVPGIQGILQKFDQEAKTELEHYKLRKKFKEAGNGNSSR